MVEEEEKVCAVEAENFRPNLLIHGSKVVIQN